MKLAPFKNQFTQEPCRIWEPGEWASAAVDIGKTYFALITPECKGDEQTLTLQGFFANADPSHPYSMMSTKGLHVDYGYICELPTIDYRTEAEKGATSMIEETDEAYQERLRMAEVMKAPRGTVFEVTTRVTTKWEVAEPIWDWNKFDYRIKPTPTRRVRKLSEIVAEAENRELLRINRIGVYNSVSIYIENFGHIDISAVHIADGLAIDTVNPQWPDWFFEEVEG